MTTPKATPSAATDEATKRDEWVLVPREPTPDMFIVGGIAIGKAIEAQKNDPEATLVDVAVACYDAMLSASPSSPTAPGRWGESVREKVRAAVLDASSQNMMQDAAERQADRITDAVLSALSPLSHSGEAVAWPTDQRIIAEAYEAMRKALKLCQRNLTDAMDEDEAETQRRLAIFNALEFPAANLANLVHRSATPVQSRDELREALEKIASQKISDDLEAEDNYDADYQFGYDEIIGIARRALASLRGSK